MRIGNTLAKWEDALYDGPPSPSKPRNTTLDGLGGPSYFRRLKCYENRKRETRPNLGHPTDYGHNRITPLL